MKGALYKARGIIIRQGPRASGPARPPVTWHRHYLGVWSGGSVIPHVGEL